MYMFTWKSPVNQGSQHGHELKFCFNTLHHSPNELPQPTQDDLRLADLMSSAWAQFAHTGNPNTDGLSAWNPYTAENGEMMILDYNCHVRNNPDRRLEEIINAHCFRQLDEFRRQKK
jgi:para-nitrobenzyl esterase